MQIILPVTCYTAKINIVNIILKYYSRSKEESPENFIAVCSAPRHVSTRQDWLAKESLQGIARWIDQIIVTSHLVRFRFNVLCDMDLIAGKQPVLRRQLQRRRQLELELLLVGRIVHQERSAV